MAASIRSVASECLNKSGTLSVREDLLGVYANDNPQNRSVLQQLNRIQNIPFVKVTVVTVNGATPNLQRDLDTANNIWLSNCGAWVYPTASITVTAANLLTLNQDDCLAGAGHSVSNEEDQLFDFGRALGADIVGYYINGDTAGNAGCAAHPADRRGFWVGNGASQWTWAHELTHVVGNNLHIDDNSPTCNLMNLMTGCGTANIIGTPNLNSTQCGRILDDEDIETC